MSKFIKLSDGEVLNIDYISHIVPVRGSSISTSNEWAMKQAGAVKRPVLQWHQCKTFAEMRQRVSEDPKHRGYASDFQNPGYYEATNELAYTEKVLDGRGGYSKCSTFLTQQQLEDVAYYVVHLVTPTGGMNYYHVTLDLTKDDYQKIEDAIKCS